MVNIVVEHRFTFVQKFININKLEYICLVSSPLRHFFLICTIKNNGENNYKKVLLLLETKELM